MTAKIAYIELLARVLVYGLPVLAAMSIVTQGVLVVLVCKLIALVRGRNKDGRNQKADW